MQRYYKYILSICFVIFGFTEIVHAQSNDSIDELQKLLRDKPSILEGIQGDNFNEGFKPEITAKNQDILDSDDIIDMGKITTKVEKEFIPAAKSLLHKYFSVLTNENLSVYGAIEFSQKQDENLIFFNTVGKDYELAPGDSIQITIRGLNSSNSVYQVYNDGSITLKNMYPINVDGLTIDQVNSLILNTIRIEDASAEVFTRLNTARLVTVQISGNVNSPRTIAVPAYTPLSRVLAYSGGVSDSGSLRNIFLSQSGEVDRTVDFYEFLQNPLPMNDPLITKNARIFVANKGSTFSVSGHIARPGIYELADNVNFISIKNVLQMAGTNFIPPGATIKVLSFDNDGRVVSRKATKKDKLYEGEALIINFVQTRELNVSRIYGSVLKDYILKLDEPISIYEALKGGASLKQDAFLSFALISGQNIKTRAINLSEALRNKDITLPVGADLLILNNKEYSKLINTDTNNINNPLIAKISDADIAEIYLNGRLIAYLPPSDNINFSDSLRGFYKPSPKTVYDIALLTNEKSTYAFSLRRALLGYNKLSLSGGDRLFVYENSFFEDLLKEYDGNTENSQTLLQPVDNKNEINKVEQALPIQKARLDEKKYLQNLSHSKKLFQQSNILKISLDGKTFKLLPYHEGIQSDEIMKIISGNINDIVNEFVIITETNSDQPPSIKNLKNSFVINSGQNIDIITTKFYDKLINNHGSDKNIHLLNTAMKSDAVKVFYDGKLSLMLAPNYAPHELMLLKKYSKNPDLYKLFISLKTNVKNSDKWEVLTYDASSFFSKDFSHVLKASNKVHLFSENFIRHEFINEKETVEIEGLDANDIQRPSEINSFSLGNTPPKINKEFNDNIKSNKLNKNYDINVLRNSLRYITGSVQYPGSYPVANEINLYDFIAAAGGISTKVGISKVTYTNAIEIDGRLQRAKPQIIDYNDMINKVIILKGIYFVNVPQVPNDAINGNITLSGEILKPGNYSFSRTETLQDVIKRAGGLSEAAYPLGAVLQRETIRIQELATNKILADQVEASVITLAQSNINGVGEQITAVLGFAKQLRNQEVVGRMAASVFAYDRQNTLYLEDGDKLTIPKRPSHVSIVGAVQRTSVSTFIPHYNFKDYINSAGGFSKMADVRRSYVLLPNGESKPLNNKTIIPAGSVLVIPPKIDKLSAIGLTDVISRVLGNIATSILAINNIK